MDDSPPRPGEVAAYERLLDLARRQGEALRRGDLDACAALMAERDRLVRALPADLSGCGPAERAGIERLIRAVLAVDGDNAILLQLLMEETARASARLGATREYGVAYRRSTGGTEAGRGGIDQIG